MVYIFRGNNSIKIQGVEHILFLYPADSSGILRKDFDEFWIFSQSINASLFSFGLNDLKAVLKKGSIVIFRTFEIAFPAFST